MTERVRACISVLAADTPPIISQDSGMRAWFKQSSLVLAPASHFVHEEVRKAGSKSKKYGTVAKPDVRDGEVDFTPLQMVRKSMPRIQEFVLQKVPVETEEYGEEVEMEDA